MRRLALATALLAFLAVAASPAHAQRSVTELRAHEDWLSYKERGARVLERRGQVVRLPRGVERVALGDDERGRDVAVHAVCDPPKGAVWKRVCEIRQRRLATGRTRVLARRRGVTAVGYDRGLLAIAIQEDEPAFGFDPAPVSRILARRAGETRFRTLRHRQGASRLEVDSGFVLFYDGTAYRERLGVIDARPAEPKVVFRQAAREPCVGCRSVSRIYDAELDGSHAHWAEEVAYSESGLGTGNSQYETFMRIRRVDFRAGTGQVEEYRTPHGQPKSIAVADGLLFHDTDPAFPRGQRPAWQPVPEFP